MFSRDYHLKTQWYLPGSVEEVAAVLSEPTDLPRWWPEVYLEVERLHAGDAEGLGEVVRVVSRGRLPFRLNWTYQVVEKRWPERARIEATGDLSGRGTWTLEPEAGLGAARSSATFDWQVRADKPLLRLLTPVLKPLFAWNHDWAMAKGEVALARELARRRASAITGS